MWFIGARTASGEIDAKVWILSLCLHSVKECWESVIIMFYDSRYILVICNKTNDLFCHLSLPSSRQCTCSQDLVTRSLVLCLTLRPLPFPFLSFVISFLPFFFPLHSYPLPSVHSFCCGNLEQNILSTKRGGLNPWRDGRVALIRDWFRRRIIQAYQSRLYTMLIDTCCVVFAVFRGEFDRSWLSIMFWRGLLFKRRHVLYAGA